MAKLINFEATKTYATVENAIKAVDKKFSKACQEANELRYFVHRDEKTGRYFPIFVGEKALQFGVHFHFHIVA